MSTNNPDIIGVLIAKYLMEELTANENTQLQDWINTSDDNKEKFEELINQFENNLIQLHKTNRYEDEVWQQVKKTIKNGTGSKVVSHTQYWWKYTAAAAIIIMAALGTFWFISYRSKNEQAKTTITVKPVQTDIAPGGTKATLTLSNGSSIVLDSAAIGQLAQQGNTQVLNKNGQLVYTPSAGGSKAEVLWNTLSTAKGQTYPLLLSDGTLVTLNSESSIRFPVAFTGNLREVQVTGEAFFQVAHDASKPFRVKARDMELQVLGTIFNVNAYEDEDAIKTTLVEGKVKVRSKTNNAQAILAPGEQAIFRKAQNDKTILRKAVDVDVDEVVAWKNGYFQFNDADLHLILKQIVRWYDVEVEFSGNVPQRMLSGKIPRGCNLSQVLKALEALGSFKQKQVHFQLEGKKITVTP